jgi:hypothetical protein
MRTMMATPKWRKARTAQMRERWTKPEYRKAIKEGLLKRHADPAFSKAFAKKIRARWADPEYRARVKAAQVAAWKRRRVAESKEQ